MSETTDGLRLYRATVTIDYLVVATSADDAAMVAEDAHSRTDHAVFSEDFYIAPATVLPPKWTAESMPYENADIPDELRDKPVGFWMEREAAK